MKIAIGVFDGVHLGHREIIKKSDYVQVISGVPRKGQFIYSGALTIHKITEILPNCTSVFYDEICDLSADEFAKNLRGNSVIIGEDFRFGKGAQGDADTFKKHGIEVASVPDIFYDGEKISSSRIKTVLENGNITHANAMLGDEYTIFAKVEMGNQVGRKFLFPTINQHFQNNQLIPKKGVYVSRTNLFGRIYKSVTNIGTRPSVTNNTQTIAETHIIGYDGDLYGKKIEVKLFSFIREETKFSNLRELKEAISKNLETALGVIL